MAALNGYAEQWWDDRLTAMEAAFGKSDGMVGHAVVPFRFGFEAGGAADILYFRNHFEGVVTATCELIGEDSQIRNSLGNYELAVCQRQDGIWGASLISKLAYYTLDASLEPGDTMEIGSPTPGSTISALLFAEFARFPVRGRRAGVLLCMGITASELAACRQGKREQVEAALHNSGAYPFTDLHRKSVLP